MPQNKVLQKLVTKLFKKFISYVMYERIHYHIKYQWAEAITLENTFSNFNIITRKRVSQNGNMKVTIQASDDWDDIIWYMVVFHYTVSIKLWWISPKAFCRSINVMVTEHCLQRASFMISKMLAICSKVPLKPGVDPFCIEVSYYSYYYYYY